MFLMKLQGKLAIQNNVSSVLQTCRFSEMKSPDDFLRQQVFGLLNFSLT